MTRKKKGRDERSRKGEYKKGGVNETKRKKKMER